MVKNTEFLHLLFLAYCVMKVAVIFLKKADVPHYRKKALLKLTPLITSASVLL